MRSRKIRQRYQAKGPQTSVVTAALAMAALLTMIDGKTFIGRVSTGFDFLGYHFCAMGLTVAAPTVARFVARARQLYEREQREPDGPRSG